MPTTRYAKLVSIFSASAFALLVIASSAYLAKKAAAIHMEALIIQMGRPGYVSTAARRRGQAPRPSARAIREQARTGYGR